MIVKNVCKGNNYAYIGERGDNPESHYINSTDYL